VSDDRPRLGAVPGCASPILFESDLKIIARPERSLRSNEIAARLCVNHSACLKKLVRRSESQDVVQVDDLDGTFDRQSSCGLLLRLCFR